MNRAIPVSRITKRGPQQHRSLLAAAILACALGGGRANAQNSYSFSLGSAGHGFAADTLTIDLGTFTAEQVAAMSATSVLIQSRISNADASDDNLLVVGLTPSYSGSAPDYLGDYFSFANGGNGPVGDLLAPGETHTDSFGAFDEKAFLRALVANGDHAQHVASGSFLLSANSADLGGNDTGIRFAADHTVGLQIFAQIVPSSPVPEAGTAASLLAAVTLGGAFAWRRSRRR